MIVLGSFKLAGTGFGNSAIEPRGNNIQSPISHVLHELFLTDAPERAGIARSTWRRAYTHC